jgi:hypothetical protein
MSRTKNFTPAELRLQNDLLDFHRHPMSTKLFDTHISDIITDQDKKLFQIKVFLTPTSGPKITKEVKFY